MNLKQLYYFKTLAKICHYSIAADELSIAQSTLSYEINQLEKELGTFLFSKQNKPITLTKSGKIFLEYVTAALDNLELGEKKIREYEIDLVTF